MQFPKRITVFDLMRVEFPAPSRSIFGCEYRSRKKAKNRESERKKNNKN